MSGPLVESATGAYIWNAPNSGYARINATFADANILGRFLIFCMVAGIVMAPSVPARRQKLVIAAAVILAAAALPFTYSRQGWTIGGALLIVAIILSAHRRQSLALGGAALLVFSLVTAFDSHVLRRLAVLEHNLTGPPTHVFQNPCLTS